MNTSSMAAAFAVSPRRPQVIPVHRAASVSYAPAENPYGTVFVDVTHRCNMSCRNCYIPNRDVPDLDLGWVLGVLRRLPRRTRIRIVGAEPTLRPDLPEVISGVREAGHIPILMTNGLKLGRRSYVATLKEAGLRTVYLSFNGGFDDDVYEAVDNLRCASRKERALTNLIAEHMYVSLGMILVRGVNTHALGDVFREVQRHRQVHELHLRSIGAIGRYMDEPPFSLAEMRALFLEQTGIDLAARHLYASGPSFADYRFGSLKLQLTEWPDLGSTSRGRLAPDGTIQPAFEHVIANQGGY
jgi:molybdenum cofactor biosynthesis enzyme MoaA